MIRAKLNYLRISPRKVRLVADLIRGMEVVEAEKQLKFLNKRSARHLLKLINSAIANARHNFNLNKEDLYISQISVNAGPVLKRWRARARGRATPILKRTSHITLVLSPQEVAKEGDKIKAETSSEAASQETKREEAKAASLPQDEIKTSEKQAKTSTKSEKDSLEKQKPSSSGKERVFRKTTSQKTPPASKGNLNRPNLGKIKNIFRRKSI